MTAFIARSVVLAMLGAAVATAAWSQAQPQAQISDAVTALVGPWEISNADRDQTCSLTLKAEPGPGGFRLEFDKPGCAAKFPPLKDVAAWNLSGDSNVRLNDARGRMIYDFTEVESGMYESLKAGQPLTFLQTAAFPSRRNSARPISG